MFGRMHTIPAAMLAAVLLAAMLAGCGQKGDLYHPPTEPAGADSGR